MKKKNAVNINKKFRKLGKNAAYLACLNISDR